ncbi:hypothetical protein TrST_g9633 [Triparma strigata]|uniref:Uncharacterized protein n=1 Tax=Triparma strigata TaxID=1606541 RepID=A0A9W7DWG5_9STRA|nr:hypothetical protein TrST_g9633 [Triparma strigata]
MALNSPLQKKIDPASPTNAITVSPHPFRDERFLLSRPQTTLSVTDSQRKYKATGTIYLTTYRLAFVEAGVSKGSQPLIHNATGEEWASVDLPLFGLFDYSFVQPVFGENSLKGSCYVVPTNSGFASQTKVTWRVAFNTGTCGGFLGAFYRVMHWVDGKKEEAKNEEEKNSSEEEEGGAAKAMMRNIDPNMAKEIKDAFVDPNDPSHIYI